MTTNIQKEVDASISAVSKNMRLNDIKRKIRKCKHCGYPVNLIADVAFCKRCGHQEIF